MTERGYYTIQTPAGKVGLRFSSWTFKRYSEMKGNIPFHALFQHIAEMTFSDFCDFLLCAAENYCKEQKEKFDYSDFDAANWIDYLGGINGKKFMEMNTVIADCFNDTSLDGTPHREVEATEDKSTDVA